MSLKEDLALTRQSGGFGRLRALAYGWVGIPLTAQSPVVETPGAGDGQVPAPETAHELDEQAAHLTLGGFMGFS